MKNTPTRPVDRKNCSSHALNSVEPICTHGLALHSVLQGLALLLDVLQLGQIIFILGTIVSVPAFVRRLCSYFTFAAEEHKNKALSRLRRLTLLSQARPHPRWLEGESAHLGPLGAISEGVLTEYVMTKLDAPALSLLGGCAPYLAALSASNQYWIPLYKQHFPSKFAAARFGSARMLFIDAERKRQGRQVLSAEQKDYNMGLRNVVHNEASDAVEQLPHFFLLPLKLAGLCLVPLFLLMNLRYQQLPALVPWIFPVGTLVDLQYDRPYDSFCSFRQYSWCWSLGQAFWTAHLFLFAVLSDFVLAIGFELSQLVVLCNVALAFVGTAGLPILVHLMPGWPPVAVAGAILTGILLPFFMVAQFVILLLPIGSSQW